MNPKRHWRDMTWEDFRQGNPAEWIAVVPVAAIESLRAIEGVLAVRYLPVG